MVFNEENDGDNHPNKAHMSLIDINPRKRKLTQNGLFSSFQCISGSQRLETGNMQHTQSRYPINEVDMRVCHMKNICLVNGTLTYFMNPKLKEVVPEDFTVNGFQGSMFHTGHLRGLTMPISVVYYEVPSNYIPHPSKITFLDAPSWSYNYGHYINDNVIPAFTAAKIFNLPFEGTQQLIETNCRLFTTLEEGFSARLVDYNHSMGTYRQACLAKFDGLHHYFFDNRPLYVDQMQSSQICFKNLIGGHGAAFGLRSLDLTRAIILRDFRDHVLKRIPEGPKLENLILVGLRTVGTAGGSLINDLCGHVKSAAASFTDYRVECMVPTDLDFVQEIHYVRTAKIVISVHGTVSYLSMFARDGTQQIVVANPKEFKENQILLWATHFHALYLGWDRLKSLQGLIHHAISLSEEFHNPIKSSFFGN
eukprot:gene6909-9461_t